MATAAINHAVKAPNPYVGPPPFRREDRERFFGRDREKSELYSLVAAHRTVLLYAQSGAGKTSLLNAKLIPELEEGGFDVLISTRFSQLSADLALENEFRAASVPTEEGTYKKNPLACFFQHALADHPCKIGSNRQPLSRVLIFDQFEEFFTSYPELWGLRQGFFEDLNRAMEAEPSLRALFAMREDFVANIDPYSDLVPEEFRTRYRLERLRPGAALEAIEKPLEKTGICFAPKVAQNLVNNLLKTPTDSQSGKTPSKDVPEVAISAQRKYLIEEYVEPVQLQVVCFSLYRKLAEETVVITDTDLATFGDVEEALREFYNSSLIETVSKTNVAEDTLRQWFEQKLITEAGTRGLVFRGETQTEGLPNPAVDALDKTHIIREEVRGQSLWYELSHDRFIRPVLRANDAWRARVHAAEREKRELERERLEKDAKRFQRLARALGFSLAIAILAVLFAGHEWSKSHKEFVAKEQAEKNAEQAKAAAEVSQKRAEDSEAIAQRNLALAIENKTQADKSARGAQEALRREKIARALAADNEKKANESAIRADANAAESKKNAEDAHTAEQESNRLKVAAEQQSRISTSRALAATSLNRRSTDPQVALWLALHSVSATTKDSKDGNALVTKQSLDALLGAMPSSMLGWRNQAHCETPLPSHADVVAIAGKIASLSSLALAGTSTPSSLSAVAFTSDDKSVVAIDREGVAHTWNVGNGTAAIVGSCGNLHPVAAALSPQGSLLAVTQLQGQTESDAPTGSLGTRSEVRVASVPPAAAAPIILPTHWYQPEALAFNEDGTLLAIGAGMSRRSVYEISAQRELWNGLTQRLSRLWSRLVADTVGRAPRVVSALAFSHDSKLIAFATADGTLELWDVHDGHMTRSPLHAHREAILALAFSPKDHLLASASRDRTALIWDLTSPKDAIVKASLIGHRDAVISIAFDPSGKLVATGSQDQTISLWSSESGQQLISLSAEGGYATCVAFSADGKMLAAVSSDGSVRVWNVSNLDQVKQLETAIQALDDEKEFHDDLRSVPSRELKELLKLGEARTTRKLRPDECKTYLGASRCPASPSTNY